MSLLQQIESSAYLTALLAQHADLAVFASQQQTVTEADLSALIDEQLRLDDMDRADIAARSEHLRVCKQRYTLLWSIADLSAAIEFSRLGALQTRFAECSIEAALDISLNSPRIRKLFARGLELASHNCGIFILGLGKLGGRDLNFSSDVDLIAFYDKKKLQQAPMVGASYAVTECLKTLSKILSDTTETGFVWRVDWRLRPHASLRNLSMVSEKALDFYHYQAQPWHRLAMIKARPVAGEIALGDTFLGDLSSFMWRRSLDFRAIDDIALLKEKINLEHPALASQRARQGLALDQGRGMNLKLGDGGIREIEFMVNALQMLWGGRKPDLRISNTLAALQVLAREDLMQQQDADALGSAYRFLRQAENRLQMQNNAQVYHVPDDEPELAAYMALWGGGSWDDFNRLLTAHRQQVYRLFEQNFSAVGHEPQQQAELPRMDEDLSEAAQGVLQGWEHGFSGYGLVKGQANQFKPLLDALMVEIRRSECDFSEAVLKIDNYFRCLPAGGQYFRLLRDYPWLLEKIIAPLLLSPTMTELLQQSPHIIDRFLEQSGPPSAKLDTTIVFSSTDYEDRLENLRRLANEELFLRDSLYFEGRTDAGTFQAQLTALAESLLDAGIGIACEQMGLQESPIAVIGFGKLGAQGMMPKSDLDLVYLCDSMQSHALASQFASRLNTIINTPMREGRVYELDTRLRPSGQSGSVTISLSSFEQHQIERAQSWSHLAMVPARFVAGNERVGQAFTQIKQALLSRPRYVWQFKNDSAKMLKRVEQQKIVAADADQFIAKNRSGGLFELEYLVNCMSVLACVHNPELGLCSYPDLLTFHEKQFPGLSRTHQFLVRLQLEIRVFGCDGRSFSELPAPVLTHVLKVLECSDTEQLIGRLAAATKFVSELKTEFFQCIDWNSLSEWKEEEVEWL